MATKGSSKKASKKPVSAKAKKTEEKPKEKSKKEQLEELNNGIEACAKAYEQIVRQVPFDADGLTIMVASARANFIERKQQLLFREKQLIEAELLK